ncbi:MAG: hypothetical protein DSO01_04740 [Archaeoglobi archaeon]|jgi:hypothetical protein|nr:MAG: hypothetical protein DSO01_04740 [Archaeoglobi archaeon]TDA29191.1 MAG: hypothetical protein DSN99_00390 [Archaeoglobi archaeon]
MGMRWVLLVVALALLATVPAIAASPDEKPGVGKAFGAGKGDEIREKMFQERKEMMTAWLQNCDRWMERLRARVEESNIGQESKLRIQERINNVENRINEIKARIESAKDYDELRNAMRESREIWLGISKEMRMIAYENYVSHIDNVLRKLDEIADRFESYGLDATQLRNAINEANSTLQSVKEKMAGGTVTPKDIAELNKKVMNAFNEAKRLAREYKPKPSDGILMANVNGNFTLTGNMTALIKGNGTFDYVEATAKSESKGAAERIEALVVRGNVNVNGNGTFKIVAHGNGTLILNDGSASYVFKQCVNQKFVNGTLSKGESISFGC